MYNVYLFFFFFDLGKAIWGYVGIARDHLNRLTDATHCLREKVKFMTYGVGCVEYIFF